MREGGGRVTDRQGEECEEIKEREERNVRIGGGGRVSQPGKQSEWLAQCWVKGLT